MAARSKRIKKKEFISDASLSSDDEEIQESFKGKLFNEKYICLDYLGKGAFCRVLLVYDISLDNYYALKIYNSKDSEEGYTECKILKMFSSEYIPKYLDLFVHSDDGKKYVCTVVELLGDCVNVLLEIFDEKIPINIVRKIIKDTLYGLNELHSKNILHADLKLDNILIKSLPKKIKHLINSFKNINKKEEYELIIKKHLPKNYEDMNKNLKKKHKKKAKSKSLQEYVSFLNLNITILNNQNLGNKSDDLDWNNMDYKLIDFGNSVIINENEYDYDDLYYRNYRSPEIILGYPYTVKSDIWCLGCILYELITGELLFKVNKNNSEIVKNRKHLLEMFKKLGPIPKEIALRSENTADLFDKKGRILRNKDYTFSGIEDNVKNINLEEKEILDLLDLLRNMLEYNPYKRFNTKKCLKHNFFNN